MNALIIVDVQTCFTSGGTLAVPDGDHVVPVINSIRENHTFDLVVRTQDWHCSDHVSFASQHELPPYTVIELDYTEDGRLCDDSGNGTFIDEYGEKNATLCSEESDRAIRVNQTMWPDHCIIDTVDATFNYNLNLDPTDLIVQKGYRCYVDSYSGFADNGGFTHTELQSELEAAGVSDVFVTGLATDFCVFYTSRDAAALGFNTWLVEDATRGISEEGVETAIADMRRLGIHVIQSSDIDLDTGGGGGGGASATLSPGAIVGFSALAAVGVGLAAKRVVANRRRASRGEAYYAAIPAEPVV